MNLGENINEPTKFAADIELTEKMEKALEKIGETRNAFIGGVLTGDIFVSTKEEKVS